MNAGNPKITFRLEPAELQAVKDFVEEVNSHLPRVPYTLADFVRASVREKVAKMRRSRRKYRKVKPPDQAAPELL